MALRPGSDADKHQRQGLQDAYNRIKGQQRPALTPASFGQRPKVDPTPTQITHLTPEQMAQLGRGDPWGAPQVGTWKPGQPPIRMGQPGPGKANSGMPDWMMNLLGVPNDQLPPHIGDMWGDSNAPVHGDGDYRPGSIEAMPPGFPDFWQKQGGYNSTQLPPHLQVRRGGGFTPGGSITQHLMTNNPNRSLQEGYTSAGRMTPRPGFTAASPWSGLIR